MREESIVFFLLFMPGTDLLLQKYHFSNIFIFQVPPGLEANKFFFFFKVTELDKFVDLRADFAD